MTACPNRKQLEYAVSLAILTALGRHDAPYDRWAAKLFLKAAVKFIGKAAVLAELETLDC